jgi:hypothetical protein
MAIDNTEGDCPGREENPQKIKESRPDHGRHRRKRVGVDDRRHRIGGVMEAVGKLEAQCQQKGKAEQEVGSGRDGIKFG